MKTLFGFITLSFLLACHPGTGQESTEHVRASGKTLAERFPAPDSCLRQAAPAGSFADFLRNAALKPDSTPVYLFDGRLKNRQDVHAAVLDIDTGTRDLQQCADAVMRLRAEYLFKAGRFADIHFNFTNGFRVDYLRWRRGERIQVKGNRARWVPGGTPSGSRESFRRYLDIVFTYAGTASLEKELLPVVLDSVRPGDVFIRGGHPGHAVIVMDVAQHERSGALYFLLAQSYMPAQDIHILQNFNDPDLSPWYAVSEITAGLRTPEWLFERDQLRRFGNR